MKNGFLRRKLRQVLYDLKRKFGEGVEVFFEGNKTLDTRTGEITVEKSSVKLRRAIVLPQGTNLGFVYSIQFIRANSNFAQGGYFHQGDRIFILDGRELQGHQVTMNSYIIFQDERYNVKDITALDQMEGVLAIARRVQGQPTGGARDIEMRTNVEVSQTLQSNNATNIDMTTNVVASQTMNRPLRIRPIQ